LPPLFQVELAPIEEESRIQKREQAPALHTLEHPCIHAAPAFARLHSGGGDSMLCAHKVLTEVLHLCRDHYNERVA